MRCYADSDALTEVTWYWVPEDRPWIDLPHVFYDRTWQLMSEPPSAVGEQLKHPPYYLGRAPVDADGSHFCGTPAAWRGEASIHDPPLLLSPDTGLPVCCGPQARPLLAGVAIGGELVQLPAESVGGGVALGGELVQVLRLDGVAIGGELEEFSGAVTHACPQRDPSPAAWRVTLAGITGGTCADCGPLNREWDLPHLTGCWWQSEAVSMCAAQFAVIVRYDDFSGDWVCAVAQVANGSVVGVFAEWRLADAEWRTFGPNVLAIVAGFGICSNWPATVTVEAVN